MELIVLFEWLDGSWLAGISKAYGGVFALVQTVHLASLAMLGGMVIASDMRLLNILMRDVPISVVAEHTTRWITFALIAVTLSGVYQASAVAMKLYYNNFFWAKMAAFAMGLVFLYAIKMPLLKSDLTDTPHWVLKLVACASLTLWFTVAATGRWIGFS